MRWWWPTVELRPLQPAAPLSFTDLDLYFTCSAIGLSTSSSLADTELQGSLVPVLVQAPGRTRLPGHQLCVTVSQLPGCGCLSSRGVTKTSTCLTFKGKLSCLNSRHCCGCVTAAGRWRQILHNTQPVMSFCVGPSPFNWNLFIQGCVGCPHTSDQ